MVCERKGVGCVCMKWGGDHSGVHLETFLDYYHIVSQLCYHTHCAFLYCYVTHIVLSFVIISYTSYHRIPDCVDMERYGQFIMMAAPRMLVQHFTNTLWVCIYVHTG